MLQMTLYDVLPNFQYDHHVKPVEYSVGHSVTIKVNTQGHPREEPVSMKMQCSRYICNCRRTGNINEKSECLYSTHHLQNLIYSELFILNTLH